MPAAAAQVAVLVDTVSHTRVCELAGLRGARVRGVVSLEELEQGGSGMTSSRQGPFAVLPDPHTETQCIQGGRASNSRIARSSRSARRLRQRLRNTLDKRGLPDVVFERRGP